MMISFIRGHMRMAEAEIELDEANPQNSWVKAKIDASTLDTRDANRDGHLKSGDFLDVENHPYIEYASTEIVPKGAKKFEVHGNLTLRGQSAPLTLQGEWEGPVKDVFSGKRKVGFLLEGDIDTEKWGITWNVPVEGLGWLIGKSARLTIDAEATEEE
jgi:polyisoprenoid-binding protein YceI